MDTQLIVQPEGWLAYFGDIVMAPFMYALSVTWPCGTYERPQRTHRWNCIHLAVSDVKHLDREKMVHCKGVKHAMRRINPLFHLPLFGGWCDYVVVTPESTTFKWHIGWIAEDGVIGISRIPLTHCVRVLVGSGNVDFFGIATRSGVQISVTKFGGGVIGDGSIYRHFPLL